MAGPSSETIRERDGVWRVVNAGLSTNTYLVRTALGSGCILIDPGMATEAIEKALFDSGLRPVVALCTHGHFDHIGSAAHFQRSSGCRVLIHEADRRTAQAANLLMMAMRIPGRIELPTFEYLEGHTGSIAEAGVTVHFHRSPGHTPGSCVFACDDMLFTGDTLFSQGIDATKFHGGGLNTLRESIEMLYARFPEETTVFPGHGSPQTLEFVKANNRAVQEFLAATGELA